MTTVDTVLRLLLTLHWAEGRGGCRISGHRHYACSGYWEKAAAPYFLFYILPQGQPGFARKRLAYGTMETVSVLPHIEPLPLVRRPAPFSHLDWLFELKYDGFRALAYVDRDSVRLVSRNGNAFMMFSDLCENLKQVLPHPAILDGEIACLDGQGRSQFNRLLFRRGMPRFCAFDLVWLHGQDLRDMPLARRKRVLRSVIPQRSPHLLYVDHLESEGERLFELACAEDLEGIVAKNKHGRYRLDGDGWIKIKNRRYSQIAGRSEFFDQDKERAARENPIVGWAVCTHACAALR